MSKTLNLFVVESRFQALVALMIARNQPESDNRVFYVQEDIGAFTQQFPFVRSVFLGNKIRHGICKRARTLKQRVNRLCSEVTAAGATTHIHYHCANLKTPLLNYPIAALKKQFPNSNITVNIITDGTSNFKRKSMSDKAAQRLQLLSQRKLYRWLGLNFTLFNRERFGIDADIVQRIYLLPGAPHEYDASRVVAVPIEDLSLPATQTHSVNHMHDGLRALVIGEKLTERGWLTTDNEQRISADIAQLLHDNGIIDIDYVPHPTATHLDLWQDHYTRVITQDPIELRLMQHRYTVIFGIASTALFTARLLQPKDGKTISIGLHCLTGRNALAETIGVAFAGMGIEVLP
jgi:hypothetical protein